MRYKNWKIYCGNVSLIQGFIICCYEGFSSKSLGFNVVFFVLKPEKNRGKAVKIMQLLFINSIFIYPNIITSKAILTYIF